MIARIASAEYSRALPRPIVTAHGVYDQRHGVIVGIWDDAGRLGIGEAAPLPGFSQESLEDVTRALASIQSSPPRSVEALDAIIGELALVPSLQFALETAILDLDAQTRNTSIAAVLSPEPAHWILVNGLIGDGEPGEMASRTQALRAAGYKTCKVKVGAGDPDRDIARIRAICAAVPSVRLRLDANGAWTPDSAERVLSVIATERIDFVEQPFRVGMAKAAKSLCDAHGVRLALDEEINSVSAGESLLRQRACDVIVLKPMILGSLRACHRLALVALERGVTVVYTSSWESDVGLAATLQLAAALPQENVAMGFSTAGMIAEGTVDQPLRIDNAGLRLPEFPGLGVRLASEFEARLS